MYFFNIKFKKDFSDDTIITVEFEKEHGLQLNNGGITIVKSQGRKYWLSFNKDEVKTVDVLSEIAEVGEIADINIESTDIENIIRNIFQKTHWNAAKPKIQIYDKSP